MGCGGHASFWEFGGALWLVGFLLDFFWGWVRGVEDIIGFGRVEVGKAGHGGKGDRTAIPRRQV